MVGISCLMVADMYLQPIIGGCISANIHYG
jgi:hypothetical protein